MTLPHFPGASMHGIYDIHIGEYYELRTHTYKECIIAECISDSPKGIYTFKFYENSQYVTDFFTRDCIFMINEEDKEEHFRKIRNLKLKNLDI